MWAECFARRRLTSCLTGSLSRRRETAPLHDANNVAVSSSYRDIILSVHGEHAHARANGDRAPCETSLRIPRTEEAEHEGEGAVPNAAEWSVPPLSSTLVGKIRVG